MPDKHTDAHDHLVHLATSAPKVRVTAGVGTLHQKTWVLRRPATLLGSGRQAHIVLPQGSINRAHCLLVNTGDALLLKDLHSGTGTQCNDKCVDLVTLSDGDVLRLGDSVLQVAIQPGDQGPDGSMSGLTYVDPLLLCEPLELRRADTGECWRVEPAVAVIGRSPGAAVRLDHPDVSLVHAAVFSVGGQLSVIDLDSRTGLGVNGESRTLSTLQAGDSLRVGPFDLLLSQLSERSGAAHMMLEVTQAAGVDRGEMLERLREELVRRGAELEQKSAGLDRDQRAVEAARLSIEKDRTALVRQAAALHEAESGLEARRRSLEQREKALRESLLRQAQGVPDAAAAFTISAGAQTDSRRMNAALH